MSLRSGWGLDYADLLSPDKDFLFLSQENGLLFHVLKRGNMIRFAFHKDHPSCSVENKSEGASGCWKAGCSLLATHGTAG